MISKLLTAVLTAACLIGTAEAATYFTGTLNAAQEVPTNSSTAVGFGRVTLNDAETQITVSLTFSGLSSNQIASHIHGPAAVGVNAPIIFNIGSSGATSGTFTGLTFAVTPAQVSQLKNGLWYFNIHSSNFPGGEIRGQLTVDAPFVATLNNNQEVPANASTGTGSGNVSLNATGTQIVMSVNFSGLTSNQIAAHIHGSARPGVNAPILFNIGATNATSGAFTDLFFNATPAQVADLKRGQFYFNVHTSNFPGGEIRGQIQRRRSTVLDFDGDAKTDYAVARRATTTSPIDWFISNGAGGFSSVTFGSGSTDFTQNGLLAGDFDGDGRDDVTVWRTGAIAFFYIFQSATSTVRTVSFGTTGDDPRMIYDYDGDGRTDPAVYRPGASGVLYYLPSANNVALNVAGIPWGNTGDFPNPGDFDGDGKGDICVQRNVSGVGNFYCLNTTSGYRSFQWGASSDFVAPGDYDGDGKTDVAVVRTISSVRTWIPLYSSTGGYQIIGWGSAPNSVRAQGDYDGDGKTDIAVWQTTTAPQRNYFVLPANGSSFFAVPWGSDGDISVNGYNVR